MLHPTRKAVSSPALTRFSEASVPTEYGSMRVVVYREADGDTEHCAIIYGDLAGKEPVLCRVHSECFTGEVLHSLKCDCREQLDIALRSIVEAGCGIVVYLRQEGRGIGLGNKIAAYALQEAGADTVDANRMLGFAVDLRRYHCAAEILADQGVSAISLLTNNPDKVAALRADGINVANRVPMLVEENEHNRDYLQTKRERLGHFKP